MLQQHRRRLPFGDERIYSRRGVFGHVELPGKHEDENVRMRAPDLAGYRISIHLRHTVVQHHKLNGMLLEEPQTDPPAAGRPYLVASCL